MHTRLKVNGVLKDVLMKGDSCVPETDIFYWDERK
jgi:hypothetical protein